MTAGATLSPPLYFEFASDDLFERSSELSAVEAVQDRIGCRISKDNNLRELPQFIAFVDIEIAQSAHHDERRPTAEEK